MDIERVKDTVVKLLRLANDDAAAQGEVDNAMRFAARLMEQHQLSEADLPKAEEKILDLERATFGEVKGWMGGHKFCHWESDAAEFACAFVGGVKYSWQDNKIYKNDKGMVEYFTGKWAGQVKTRTQIRFYGIMEDVEVAFEVYNTIIMTVATMAKLRWGGVYRGPGRNYCEGFIAGLWEKWHRDRDSQKKLAAPTGTALMVIDKRNEIVAKKEELAKNWLEVTKGVKLRTVHLKGSSGGYHGEANQEGREDGKQYDATVVKQPKAKRLN